MSAKEFITRVGEVLKLNKKGKRLDAAGRELLDSVPLSPPVSARREMSFDERLRQAIRSERLSALAASAGQETFEEADDFVMAEDPEDPRTPYEQDFEGGSVRELKARAAKAKEEAEAAERALEAKRAAPPRQPRSKVAPEPPQGAVEDGSEAQEDEED